MNMRTDYKDGWLCVREEENLMDIPVLRVTWWPIVKDSRASLESLDLLDKECSYSGGGQYSIRLAAYQNRMATLTNGGQTTALALEDTPIPAPKVRKGIETRYRNSAWQKLTAKGWISA